MSLTASPSLAELCGMAANFDRKNILNKFALRKICVYNYCMVAKVASESKQILGVLKESKS
jgi:hypothetical protein